MKERRGESTESMCKRGRDWRRAWEKDWTQDRRKRKIWGRGQDRGASKIRDER